MMLDEFNKACSRYECLFIIVQIKKYFTFSQSYALKYLISTLCVD